MKKAAYSLVLVLALSAACKDDPKPNESPTVEDVTASTAEDTPVGITVSPQDADGDALDIAFAAPSHGTLTGEGPSVTYTPEANFHGEDTFQVTVSDGKAEAMATVKVMVQPVNDPPVAGNVTAETIQNAATPIVLAATDPEGDALTFIPTAPAHGTLSGSGATLTYTPAADFQGQDSFTFEASDGTLASNTATVSITVHPLPVCGDGRIDPGEVCDDGNRTAGDGCRADCRGTEVCGDGRVDSTTGEQCDDGNLNNGDGCDASCRLDAFSNVPAQVISGELSCTTSASNTGRKAAVDALGRFFVVMNCGGTGYVSVSLDRGLTWAGPTSLGITGVADIAIEGGPTGVAYVVALANPGKVIFTRTLDAGATWQTPRELSNAVEAEVSLDSLGDAVYISISAGSGTLRILRNFSRGEGEFIATELAQANSFHDLIVDKISGDVFSVSDNPAFHIRRSSDGGASFGIESAPPGQAFFSDWTGSNGFIYAVGTFGDDNVDVIPVSGPGTSSQVTGLPTDVGPGPFRSIDSDALGNGYVVTQLSSGAVQLDRMLAGASSIAVTDARPIGTGTYPAVAALPSNNGALVAYTSDTKVYGAIVVY